MKKALIASTALLLTAGVAAADVKISGYGRTGVIYYENNAAQDAAGLNESRVVSRLRMNIDASSSTDSGVDFGARFRLQWDQGSDNGQAQTNAGKLWVSAQGFTVEVGNVDTAFDSNGLIYETELGSYDRSVGFSDVAGAFFAYDSNGYVADQVDRVGIRALYTLGDLKLQASYVDPDQSGLNEVLEEEFGFSVDYTWNERLELSAAAAFNGAGIDGNDIYFLGARYAVLDNARIGLNFVDAGDEEDGFDGKTIALYGDYTLADGRTNLEAYIANNDRDSNETDNAFGIGVNYDLGGARLGASLQRDYAENVTADFGVRFEF
ncbi:MULTISPECIES: porin [Paracoccus]|jgi:outer membrane protein OmpU|uniref:porin n=1 Tax=Paracoccus TaxID=265 RepID=UPI0025897C19|nr:porin [Paracoccus sp. (in: a-proteobacteria)]